jgi:hypothetical protein
MITSSSIPYITQMLNEPHSITDADIDSIVSLTETYPYFVPARYMEAASRHKHQPFSADMMNTMQLYMGNWIIFHQYMQTANNAEFVSLEMSFAESADTDTVTEEEILPDQSIDSIWAQDDEEEDEISFATEEETEVVADEYAGEDVYEEEEVEYQEEEEDDYNEITAEEYFEEEDEEYFDEEGDGEQEEALISAGDEEEINPIRTEADEALILPIYTEDYFLHQGIQVSNNIPPAEHKANGEETTAEDPKSLMIVMSYSDWLMHFKTHGEKVKEEEDDQKALKTMWQKEKLAAALEEENEEIPENVFEMAVNSITREESLVSEPLAEIYVKQGKYDAAIDMYKKLSLRNPQKNAYFARKVEELLKEK